MHEDQECVHPEWNISAEVALIEEPPIAAGHFLTKIVVSCGYCGLTLHSIDDGRVLPYLETVLYR
jgi:hypothetical protein